MKNYLKNIFSEVIESTLPRVSYVAQQDLNHELFSYIGTHRLKAMIEDAEKSGETYISLAELFSHTMRKNLAKENNDIIHAIFELKPKLNDFQNAFNEKI